MNVDGYLDDDNLLLYAMDALSADESRAVAVNLAANADLQRRYADIRLVLGLYGTASVEQVDVPESSLQRLMGSIADEKAAGKSRPVLRMPAAAPAPPVALPAANSRATTPRTGNLVAMPWLGWAIAALLLVTAGAEFVSNRNLRHSSESNSAQLQQATDKVASLSQERDALQSRAEQEASRASASAAELSSRSAQLSEQASAAAARAEQEHQRAAQLNAQVSAEANRAARESTRAADLAAVAAATSSERDQLQNALNRQQDQISQLGAQTVEARQVLDALSDPQALRATLTIPKQKKTPSGRGTYVPSRGTLLFAGSNLPQLTDGKVYELWLMPSDGSAPIPAGTFSPDASGNATLVSTTFRKSIAAKGFAVTAERAGGSQTPTLPILLAAL